MSQLWWQKDPIVKLVKIAKSKQALAAMVTGGLLLVMAFVLWSRSEPPKPTRHVTQKQSIKKTRPKKISATAETSTPSVTSTIESAPSPVYSGYRTYYRRSRIPTPKAKNLDDYVGTWVIVSDQTNFGTPSLSFQLSRTDNVITGSAELLPYEKITLAIEGDLLKGIYVTYSEESIIVSADLTDDNQDMTITITPEYGSAVVLKATRQETPPKTPTVELFPPVDVGTELVTLETD